LVVELDDEESGPLRETVHKGERRYEGKTTDVGQTRPTSPDGRTRRMDWRHRAACRDEDPELFFPIGTTGPALLQVDEAKAVCRRCEAVDECLSWALDSDQDAGVWGGLSEDERRAARRRRVRTVLRTA
jgi:WhiB family transcriptional regulator, redox-sensing transcriptional regulator